MEICLIEASADAIKRFIGILRKIPMVKIAISSERSIATSGLPIKATILSSALGFFGVLPPCATITYKVEMAIKRTGISEVSVADKKEGVSSSLNSLYSPTVDRLPFLEKASGTIFFANFVKRGPAMRTVGTAIIKP